MANKATPLSPQIVPTLQRVYGLVDEACRAAGDMDVIEYLCLVDVAEHASGLQHREIATQYAFLQEALTPFAALEQKELIERRRSESDRRSFAFVSTLKGQDRLALIDKAVAFLLVGSTPRATEERFEQFISQMHVMAQQQETPLLTECLFPAFFLRSLCDFHARVLEECSVAGVSTTAFAILNLLQDQSSGLNAQAIALRVGVSELIIDALLERMEDRHWLRNVGDTYTISTTGKQKCAALDKGVTEYYSSIHVGASSEQQERNEQVVENCLYLFG